MKCSLWFYLLYEFEDNLVISLVFWPIWAWSFLFGNAIMDSIPLADRGLVRQSIYSCMTFGRLSFSMSWSISFWLSNFRKGIHCLPFVSFPINRYAVMPLLPLQVLVIYTIWFFLVYIKTYWFCGFFSKDQPYFYWLFYIGSWFLTFLISALTLIPFLSMSLYLIHLCLSGFLN